MQTFTEHSARAILLTVSLLMCACAGTAGAPSGGPVLVRIDSGRPHQVIEGFGATTTEYFDMANGTDQMGSLRPRVIEAIYGDVGITMGHLDVSPYESLDPTRLSTANDDEDPDHFNWPAFNFVRSDGQKTGIVDLARPYGFDNFTIHAGMNVRWSDPWMAAIRRADRRRYLQEMAENVVAPLIYWRDHFGIVTRWHHLFNEPSTGNKELAGADSEEIVDLVKATGERFRREGFGALRFVVPSEETEEASLATAQAILGDRTARQYVGAISYHTYPYGSVYSDVNRILATSGAGRPDPGRIRVRNQIRDLARQYGVQVWMTEVFNPNAVPSPFDAFRARAIHIHDELRYADASSYWGMWEAWDVDAPHGACGEDCIVEFDRKRGTVRILAMGRAIGNYARWVRRGAVRLESDANDPLMLVSAFRDDSQRRIVAVLINNSAEERSIVLTVRGMTLTPPVKGEQSSALGYWLPVGGDATAGEDGSVTTTVPPLSVTTLSAAFR